MKVEYVDHMGDDLSVVNAARVSFRKQSDPVSWRFVIVGREKIQIPLLSGQDESLIRYLAREGHWSPFAHTTISLRMYAPLFVARQLAKHQVGFSWNEVSRRYVDDPPELFWPEQWRYKAPNAKQGSSDIEFSSNWLDSVKQTANSLVDLYGDLIDKGLCPEQARMFLPQNMYTEWIWTGSVTGFYRVVSQRMDHHTQQETRVIANKINDICNSLFPVSWKALKGEPF